MVDERLSRHAVVARCIGRRHASLVAPEQMHVLPVDAIAGGTAGESGVQLPWCRASGQHQREPAAERDGSCGPPDHELGRRVGERVGGVKHLNEGLDLAHSQAQF